MHCVMFYSNLFLSVPLSLTYLTSASEHCNIHYCLGADSKLQFKKNPSLETFAGLYLYVEIMSL